MGILERFRLDEKVAIVTGASSGLGAAIAIAFAEAGADVALGARRVERLKQTADEIASRGRTALCVETDVTDHESCARLAQQAFDRFGHVDALVNTAGVAGAIPALREGTEHFRNIVDTNLMGTFWMSQACANLMRPGSNIVNVGSVLAT
jgi:NAD(P)-dependent dehydrogenase (short-subunit alcohol dehydrogenase family)